MTALVLPAHRFRRYCRLFTCVVWTGLWSTGCFVGTAEAQQVRKLIYPTVPLQPAAQQIQMELAPPQQAPLADTFRLHSRPTATKVIYLDFDGHSTTGTAWNSGGNTITTAPYSLDGNAAFSNTELTNIQVIWQAVAEYFSPFHVDVTTEEPPLADLMNTGSGDTRWGIRVATGPTTPDFAGAIGIAFLNSFNWDTDTPTFVMPEKTGYNSIFTALVTAHEVGHTLGLNHDGYPANAYYPGHGTGITRWGPIMGAADQQNVLQWSKGEYSTANNQEDDLVIITTRNGFGYRPDDYASALGTAGIIRGVRAAGTVTVDQTGVIEQRTDSDWFKINAGAGSLRVSAKGGPVNSMLDVQLELYDIKGALIASSNPATDIVASISKTVTAGTYFVKVDGVGMGDPLGTGYTDYGSLGQYQLTGSYVDGSGTTGTSNVIATYNAGSKTLTISGDQGKNSVSLVRNGSFLKVEGGAGTTVNKKASEVFTLAANTGDVSVDIDLREGDDILSLDAVGLLNAKLNLGAGADNLTIKNCPTSIMTINGDTAATNTAGKDSVVIQNTTIRSSLICNLGPFDDKFSLSACTIKSLNLQLGSGNDQATLAYSNLTTLSVDGGAGTDSLVRTTTTVTNTPTITNIP